MKLGPENTAVTRRVCPTKDAQPQHAQGGEDLLREASRNAAGNANSQPTQTLKIRKIDTTLREFKLEEAEFSFELKRELGSSAYQLAHDFSSEGTELYAASCISHAQRDLKKCAAKITGDIELAHNEWDHLVNIRSTIFPTAFMLGKLVDENAPGPNGERIVIIMELIEGETLSSLMEQGFGEPGDPAPVEKALEIISPLASGFHDLELSLHPFVHRDVKPDNIIISTHGGKRRVRMIDLGVASHKGDPLQRAHMGCSAGFAAPELDEEYDYPQGELFSIDDSRIDTYGLAATFCALVTGEAPRAGHSLLEPSSFLHDERTLEEIANTAKQAIYEKHLIDVDEALLGGLLAQAVSARDKVIARAVNAGLEPLQSKRPTPVAFFESLPTNYHHAIANDVHLLFLEHLASASRQSDEMAFASLRSVLLQAEHAVDLSDTALDDSYRYPGFEQDFHQAMELYNAGRYHEAVPLLAKLDEAGDPTSSYNLGVCYKDGLGGLPQDEARKLACWTRAAEGGHIMAVFNVGACHEKGLGIPVSAESHAAAISWYQRAAEAGLPAAAARLQELEG